MATMIPKDVEIFTTEGEKQVYHFLESVAKPDSQYIAWYTPDLKGKEPDFILFGDKIGLIVFEVKDWALEQRALGDVYSIITLPIFIDLQDVGEILTF